MLQEDFFILDLAWNSELMFYWFLKSFINAVTNEAYVTLSNEVLDVKVKLSL
jgi:hypothetical protein